MTTWAVDVESDTGAFVAASAVVDPRDPVFAGHYPGFPILPGLYLVEYVRSAVRASRGPLRPTALDKIKFLRPVYQGDRLSIQAALTDQDDGGLDCAATVLVEGAAVARITLSYAPRSRS
jgi:3-hydroxyacyl-[acyl-carrier-protein] dehydratase